MRRSHQPLGANFSVFFFENAHPAPHSLCLVLSQPAYKILLALKLRNDLSFFDVSYVTLLVDRRKS